MRSALVSLVLAGCAFAQQQSQHPIVNRDIAGTTTIYRMPDGSRVEVKQYPGQFGTTWVKVDPPTSPVTAPEPKQSTPYWSGSFPAPDPAPAPPAPQPFTWDIPESDAAPPDTSYYQFLPPEFWQRIRNRMKERDEQLSRPCSERTGEWLADCRKADEDYWRAKRSMDEIHDKVQAEYKAYRERLKSLSNPK